MPQELEPVKLKMQVHTRLEKIREGETEPYEVIEETSYHDADGTEITDQVRSEVMEVAEKLEQEFGVSVHIVGLPLDEGD